MKLGTKAPAGLSMVERFWIHVEKAGPDQCWPWSASRRPDGYGQFRLDGQRMRRASRMAWELEKGPIPPGLMVCHACDNPPCCNPGHLFLGTGRENAEDASRKGLVTWKLTRAAVEEIRRRLAEGEAGKVLAERFGVSRSAISQVKYRKIHAVV